MIKSRTRLLHTNTLSLQHVDLWCWVKQIRVELKSSQSSSISMWLFLCKVIALHCSLLIIQTCTNLKSEKYCSLMLHNLWQKAWVWLPRACFRCGSTLGYVLAYAHIQTQYLTDSVAVTINLAGDMMILAQYRWQLCLPQTICNQPAAPPLQTFPPTKHWNN